MLASELPPPMFTIREFDWAFNPPKIYYHNLGPGPALLTVEEHEQLSKSAKRFCVKVESCGGVI